MEDLMIIITLFCGLHLVQSCNINTPHPCVSQLSMDVSSYLISQNYCDETARNTVTSQIQSCQSMISSECDADGVSLSQPLVTTLNEQVTNITAQICGSGSGDCSQIQSKMTDIGNCVTDKMNSITEGTSISAMCMTMQEILDCVGALVGTCDSPLVQQTIAPVEQSAQVCPTPLTFQGKEITAQESQGPLDCSLQMIKCVSPEMIAFGESLAQQATGSDMDSAMVDVGQICKLIDVKVLQDFVTCYQGVIRDCPSIEGSEDMEGLSPTQLALYEQICSCDSLVKGMSTCITMTQSIEMSRSQNCSEVQSYACCVHSASRDCPKLTQQLIAPEQQSSQVTALMNQCNIANTDDCPNTSGGHSNWVNIIAWLMALLILLITGP